MKNVAIIQARLGSTRLPAKVLRKIQGKTVLERVVAQISRCTFVDEIVVATSNEQVDRPLLKYCQQKRFNVLAGSETDVARRLVDVAVAFEADNVIRIGGHCPLIDAGVVDQVISQLLNDPFLDFSTNLFPQSRYPTGLGAEAFTLKTLLLAEQLAANPDERANPALQIYRNPNLYQIGGSQPESDYSDYQWSITNMHDLNLVSAICKHFADRPIRWRDIVKAYRVNPQWAAIQTKFPKQRAA